MRRTKKILRCNQKIAHAFWSNQDFVFSTLQFFGVLDLGNMQKSKKAFFYLFNFVLKKENALKTGNMDCFHIVFDNMYNGFKGARINEKVWSGIRFARK